MATAARAARRIDIWKESMFLWGGKDKAGKVVRGEMRASGEALVQATLRREGVLVTKIKKQVFRRGGRVTEKPGAAAGRPRSRRAKSCALCDYAFLRASSLPKQSKIMLHSAKEHIDRMLSILLCQWKLAIASG